MRKILTAFIAIVLLASCQKELSFDSSNPGSTGGTGSGGGTGSTNGMLWKAVSVAGPETQTTIYTYDSQNRLETMTMTGTSGGFAINNFTKYIRDNSGRIVKTLQKMGDIMGVPSDTAVFTYHYPNATTLNYDYSVCIKGMSMGGITMATIDSNVYTYSGSKMMFYYDYMSSSLIPGIGMTSKYEFTYDASDKVTNMKSSSDLNNPGGPLEDDMTWKWTYASTTVNNVYSTTNGAQNFAMHGLPNTAANIVTKMESNAPTTTPPTNAVITTTYVNGAGNKPVTAQVISTVTGQPTLTSNYTFYYR